MAFQNTYFVTLLSDSFRSHILEMYRKKFKCKSYNIIITSQWKRHLHCRPTWTKSMKHHHWLHAQLLFALLTRKVCWWCHWRKLTSVMPIEAFIPVKSRQGLSIHKQEKAFWRFHHLAGIWSLQTKIDSSFVGVVLSRWCKPEFFNKEVICPVACLSPLLKSLVALPFVILSGAQHKKGFQQDAGFFFLWI